MLATYYGDTEEVIRLIKGGVDVNEKGGDMKETALHVASTYGNSDIFIILIKSGADIDAKDGHSGITPAQIALNWKVYNVLAIFANIDSICRLPIPHELKMVLFSFLY